MERSICLCFLYDKLEGNTPCPRSCFNKLLGMQLDLFVDQNEYTSNTEEAGIRVVISDQGIMPFPDEQGFSVPTGFSTTVGIRRVSK